MLFTDLALHFNALNTKLQEIGKTAERMFCDQKVFERKLQVFENDIESAENLKNHLENSTIFPDRFLNKQEMFKKFQAL